MNKIQIDSFLDFQFVSNPSFSPDGKWVAFVVQNPNLQQNNYQGDLYLLENSTQQVRRLTGAGDAKNYCWTPQNTLLFSAMRDSEDKKAVEEGKELAVFYEISPTGGEAVKAISLPIQATRLMVVDSQRFAVLATHDNNRPDVSQMEEKEATKALKQHKTPAYDVFEELPFWANGNGVVNRKRTRLYLYNRETQELEAVTEPFFSVEGIHADEKRIIYRGASYQDVCPIQKGIYCYDLTTKEHLCILPPEKMKTGFLHLAGEQLYFAATEGKVYGSEDYCDFYLYDFASSTIKKIADYDASIGYGSVGSDARFGGGRGMKLDKDLLYFTTTIEDSTYLRSINQEGKISDVITRIGSIDSFDMHEGNLIYCGMFDNHLTALYNQKGEKLTHFNDAWEESHSISTPEMHTYVGKDGVEIHGWAMKPVGYSPDKQYPAILHIHGGPRTAFGNILHHEMQVWANAGYFVFFCNPRGSDGRGAEFGYITGKYGVVEYDNLMEFCDKMLEKYPEVDSARFGVTGGSYGGFMTNWIIGHTQRFAAAASQRSIANWISFEHTTDIGYFFTPHQIGTTTGEDVEKLWWHSPLKYADQAKTPTLFIHSEEDYRCWMAEALAMFTALKLHGVDSRLCLFKGENHELSRSGKPQNRIRRMEEILNWMDKYLKPESEVR